MSEILVIGGGVSGLAAGIYAQRNGHHATVCEKYAVAGGNLTAWKRQGYTIDTCIHWLTGTNPAGDMYAMWEDLGVLGEDVEILRPQILYAVEHEGRTLALYRDLDRTVTEMLEISPEDKKQIRDFEHAVQFMHIILHTYGPKKNERPGVFTAARYLPALAKYFTHNLGELAGKFRHPLLKKFISYLMGRHFNGVDLAFVAATFTGDNADLPRGLSKPMAERMVRRLKDLGGTLILGAEAEEALVEGDLVTGVRFKDGTVRSADHVIFAIDPAVTFGKLLPNTYMPRGLKKQFDDPRFYRFSSSHGQFACSKPKLPFTDNIIVDIPEEYREILKNHRLTIRSFDDEPSFAPEGASTIQVMVYCKEEGCRHFIELKERDPEAYAREKEQMGRAMQAVAEAHFPALAGTLTVLDVWTPATYKRYTGSVFGNYQGFINPKMKAPKKVDIHIPGLKNAMMASQWRMSPGGLPVAAAAGRKAVYYIDGYLK